MRIRDVTCTVLRSAPGARGYPLIRVWGEDGLVGYGEASPMHPDVTKAIVDHQLKSLLVGMDARDIEACWEKMYVTTKTPTRTYLADFVGPSTVCYGEVQ